MKERAVIEIETKTYAEQQFIMNRFPDAVWVAVREGVIRFYLPYHKHAEVKETLNEWENKNG